MMNVESPLQIIRRIEKNYFEVLKRHFHEERRALREGVPIEKIVSDKISAETSSIVISSLTSRSISAFGYHLDELFKEVGDFWKIYGNEMVEATRRLEYFTIYHSMHHSLTDSQDLIKKLSLYFDTIFTIDSLQYDYSLDSFMESHDKGKEHFERMSWYKKTIMFSDYLMKISLEDVILADCEPPIVVVYPSCLYSDYNHEEAPAQQHAFDMMNRFLCSIMNEDPARISFTDLVKKLSYLSDEELNNMASSYPLLVEIYESTLPTDDPLYGLPYKYYPSIQSSQVSWRDRLTTSAGLNLLLTGFSSLFFLDFESRGMLLEMGIPEPYWELYQWKLNLEQSLITKKLEIGEGEAIVNILLQKNLNWIAGVTTQDIIKLRESGQLEEMRNIFRISRQKLRRASLDEYPVISLEVEKNLLERVSEFNKDIEGKKRDLQKKFRISLTGVAFSASLGIASALMPWVAPLAISSLVASIGVGAPSIKGVIDSVLTGKREIRELSSRPIALMLDARKKYSS